jgi:hypothetical protein
VIIEKLIKSNNNIKFLTLKLYLLTLVIMVGVVCPCNAISGSTGFPTAEAQQRAKRVITAATKFQQSAIRDYQSALKEFASPAVRKQFETLTKTVWGQSDPKIGWSFFFTLSPFTVGNILGNSPLIAYYQPWADVFLLTQWNIYNGKPGLRDIEIVPGEILRNQPDNEVSALPLWLQLPYFQLASLGVATVSSLTAFENRFPPESLVDWRAQIPELATAELSDLSRKFSGMALLKHTMHIAASNTRQDGEDNRLPEARRLTHGFLKAAGSGTLDNFLDKYAQDTLPKIRQWLTAVDSKQLAGSFVVATILAPDGIVVFLAPSDSPGFSISLLLEKSDKTISIRRVDAVSYQALYTLLTSSSSPAISGGTK